MTHLHLGNVDMEEVSNYLLGSDHAVSMYHEMATKQYRDSEMMRVIVDVTNAGIVFRQSHLLHGTL